MKKKITIKKLLMALAVILALGIIAGGVTLYLKGANKLTDAEAEKVLEELLPKADEVNEIIWGNGLPVAEGQDGLLSTVTGAQYRSVDENCGYENIEAIKKAIAEVYSQSYIESDINKILFEGDLEDLSFLLYPRYMENDEGKLIINIAQNGFDNVGENKIDPSTVKVTGAKFKEVYITVTQTLFNGEKEELELTLVKEKDGWKLNDPTY